MKWHNGFLLVLALCLTRAGLAQEPANRPAGTPSPEVVLPYVSSAAVTRGLTRNEPAAAKLESVTLGRWKVPKVSARVKIQNDLAETQLDFFCTNTASVTAPAQIALPVPATAQLVQGKSLAAGCEVVSAKNALPVWQSYARQIADPGPIEFCGWPLLQTGPMSIPAGKSEPIELTYKQTLPQNHSRFDYVLPRSESIQYAVPWSIELDVQADRPISTVYSPSHKLRTERISPNVLHVTVDETAAAQPGAFWLSYLQDGGEVSATLFTQPDETTPAGGGTFLFLAGLPAEMPADKALSREFTLALDRSASMQGKKIEQVRDAAVQVVEGLKDGEFFNIVTYNDKVHSFAEKPVRKTPETLDAAKDFIKEVKPRGGTDLNGALLESVRQEPTAKTLPIVLFLTDGLPTVGETDEVRIRDAVAKQNPFRRRIFTVGVGVDVNTPLLETIATQTRAQPAFVLPTENIQAKIAGVFKSLENPVLADARLDCITPSGQPAPSRIGDVFPNPLPDLFQDDHLVVLGRYQGSGPLTFRIQGNYLGEAKTFEFTFPLKDQPAYPFVVRLWATRKIADLVRQIRHSGAEADPYTILSNPKQDPKLKTLAEDILQLTTRYGIVTEYTAFLAESGNTSLSRSEQLNQAYRNFDERAVKTRVGLSSVNQSINNSLLGQQHYLNGGNYYWDANMRRVAATGVQQLGRGAYFLRGDTWVDGRLADQVQITPQEVVSFGSPAYDKLLHRLVTKGEHTPLSLNGNVLMQIDNKPVLVCPPAANPVAAAGAVEARVGRQPHDASQSDVKNR